MKKRCHIYDKGLFLLLVLILVISCSPWAHKGANLSWTEGVITFFSDREVISEGHLFREADYLLMMNESGNTVMYLVGIHPILRFPIAWSSDGSTMAVVAYDEQVSSFCLLLVHQNNRECVIVDGHAPSLSPDGHSLAFSARLPSTDTETLYLMELESRTVKMLIEMPKTDQPILSTWSPDSQWLAYNVPNTPGKEEIWLVDINNKDPRRLTMGGLPAWSPANDEIAFVRDGNIWLYDVKLNMETLLIDDPVWASWPAWSPDGQQLLFTSGRDGNSEIYRVNRNGSGLVNLTNDPASDEIPSWRP